LRPYDEQNAIHFYMPEPKNVVIIGSGPAGWTAAIYAARANLSPVLFEGAEPGGQLMTTTDVENFPGFLNGVMGPELMQIMRDQAKRFGTEIISKVVTSIDLSSKPYKVTAGDMTIEAKTIIISTGATARRLGLESEKKLYGHGVSACATCDGFFFRGKRGSLSVGEIVPWKKLIFSPASPTKSLLSTAVIHSKHQKSCRIAP